MGTVATDTDEIALTTSQAAALADVRLAGIVGARWATRIVGSKTALDDALDALDIDGLPARPVPVGGAEAAALARHGAKSLVGVSLPASTREAVDWICEALPPIATATAGMERREFAGFPIVIEYPAGSIKSGIGVDGEVWSRVLTNDYGYVAVDRDGGDGEPVDVYLGPDESAPWVFWICQTKPDGTFDEWKLMLGFADEAAARATYNANCLPELCGDIQMQSAGLLRGMFGLARDEDPDATLVLLCDLMKRSAKQNAVRGTKMIPYQDAAGEQRFVLDIVLEPTDGRPGETTDADGDVYSAEQIEGAQQLWTEHFRVIGDMHRMIGTQKVRILENYIVRCDGAGIYIGGQFVRRGSWLIAYRVLDDQTWRDVKEGRISGMSAGGYLRRDPILRAAA